VQSEAAVATKPSLTPARMIVAASFALVFVVLLVGAWKYRWMSDDGFINLRVVKQFEDGHGLVFNRGERVEASTSPLWVAVLIVADLLLPLRLEWIAVFTGITATVAGVALLLYGAWKLLPERAGTIVLPAGIWVLVAFAPQWKFASSGLENGLFMLWFGATFALLARWCASDASRPSLGTAVVIGIGPLIRPDLALMSACFVIAVIVARHEWRGTLQFLVAVLALPVLYEVFRMGYYDSLVPNTALAKEASRAAWHQGWTYVRVSVQPYWLWIPLIALAVGGYAPVLRGHAANHDRRRLAVTIASLAAGATHLLYVVRVGGDFMHGRMVLPGLTAVIAPVAVLAFTRSALRIATLAIVAVWAIIAIGVLRSSADAPIVFIGTPRNAVTLADFGWQPGGPNRSWYAGPGVYFNERRVNAPPHPGLPPSDVASFGIGMSSYALGTNVYVLDMLGLADPVTAHLELKRRGVIGHEKPLPIPWVAARLVAPGTDVGAADFPLPSFFIARPLDDHPQGTFEQRVDAARAALACGQLRALQRRVSGHLSPGGFAANLWHSFADTRMRIPPEPADAVARFCRS